MKHLNIVLVEPEIPQNTGNISRTCACTGASLHLVRPLGFSIDDAHLKRAGLDYWKYLDVTVHDSLEAFLDFAKGKPMRLASTKAAKNHTLNYIEFLNFVNRGEKGKTALAQQHEQNYVLIDDEYRVDVDL